MKKIFSIDRIEDDIAVCLSDDGIMIDVPLATLGEMRARDIFSAELSDGGSLSDIVPMPEERDRRLKANQERLRRLAKREN